MLADRCRIAATLHNGVFWEMFSAARCQLARDRRQMAPGARVTAAKMTRTEKHQKPFGINASANLRIAVRLS
jgi:hypothetical protein